MTVLTPLPGASAADVELQHRRQFMLRALGDYRPHIVRINEDFAGAGPVGKPAVFDIGIPRDWSEALALRVCLLWAALQYQFWSLGPAGEYVRFWDPESKRSGANLLTAAVFAAVREDAAGNPALDYNALGQALGEFPSSASRIAIIREQRTELATGWLARRAVEIAEHGAVSPYAADRLATWLPLSFGDAYLKKAQLGLSAFAAWLTARGKPVHQQLLTVYADYQVPKVMAALGVLEYSGPLQEALANHVLLERHGVVERALRAASILAGDLLARRWGVAAAEVDFWMWQQRDQCANALPHHLTLTTEY